MKILVKVTQEHIDKAERCSGYHNPVALAMKPMFHGIFPVNVGYHDIEFFEDGVRSGKVAWMPEIATRWMYRFDSDRPKDGGQEVYPSEPFEFELELPEGVILK